MANRPVFIAGSNLKNLVIEENCEFIWHPGFAVAQKQKSIDELHLSFKKKFKNKNVLEVSSKSKDVLGVSLSAFNLMVKNIKGKDICSVECLFQASKKFRDGGPYPDILNKNSIEAKKDERLKNSGDLIGFQYKNTLWGLEPKTYFYDWIYINSLYQNKELSKKVVKYDAFTDIEFNPKKSINNQARSAALYVSLHRLGILKKVILNKNCYLNIVCKNKTEQLKFL